MLYDSMIVEAKSLLCAVSTDSDMIAHVYAECMQLACDGCIIPLLIPSKMARDVSGCGKQDTIL